MVVSLGDRQKGYEDAYDHKIIRRLPIIIRVDGKGFSKLTRRLPKPYSHALLDLMTNTMLSVAKDIEGCIFAYQQSDEISFILRNDQSFETEAWYSNRIQKVGSITASLATYHFNNLLQYLEDKPDLAGPAIFDARVFAVPSINEVINNLIFRQQDCIRNAISSAAQAELGKKFGRKTAIKMLHEKDTKSKVELLQDTCDIDYNEYYTSGFRLGVAAYRVPKIVTTEAGQITRQRWAVDDQLPEFVTNKDFLSMLNSGRDIFRAERDLDENEE